MSVKVARSRKGPYRFGTNTYWFLGGGPLHGAVLPVGLDAKGCPPTYYEMTILATDPNGYAVVDREARVEVRYPYYELWGDGHYHYLGESRRPEFVCLDGLPRRA